MSPVPTARRVAAHVLERVAADGSYAAPALDAELSRNVQLAPRDRALATEIVYGALRVHGAILERLGALASRGLPNDPVVRSHLVVAAYQILLLDRVPARAAVDEAVEAIKADRGPKLAGFANALLRKLAGGERLDPVEATIASAPAWIRQRLAASVGEEAARGVLAAGADLEARVVTVRVREGRELPAWLDEAERGRISPLARRVRGGGDPERLPGYDAGAFVVQEEGAQVLALAVGARGGERVLDACAGRGQKTSLFSEKVGIDGVVWAADLRRSKLEALQREHERLGLAAPSICAVDWTLGTADAPDDFDRVLVDAPCTGIGSLRRRPEILLRMIERDPERLGALSEKLLRAAATRARPGGRVIFGVCSVLREECEAVTVRVLDRLEPVPFDAPDIASVVPPDATSFRLLPGEHGTDGYFVASFRRR